MITITARACLKLLVVFVVLFSAAYLLQILFVPDAVPIADRVQPGWQVQIAFLLATLENVALIGSAVVLLLLAWSTLRRRLSGPAAP